MLNSHEQWLKAGKDAMRRAQKYEPKQNRHRMIFCPIREEKNDLVNKRPVS